MIGDLRTLLLTKNVIRQHVIDDVHAGVFDVELFLHSVFPRRAENAVTRQRWLHAVTKHAEAEELKTTLHRMGQGGQPGVVAVLWWAVAIVLFFLVELWSLARIFLNVGVPPAGAYGTSLIVSSMIFACIRGLVRARGWGARAGCSLGLLIIFLTVARFRSGEYTQDGGPVDVLSSGVLAVMATGGAAAALHFLTGRVRETSDERRRFVALTGRWKTTHATEQQGQKWLEKANAKKQADDAREAQLRAEYIRLHRIESAKLHGAPPPSSDAST